jgi:hypothetical protein
MDLTDMHALNETMHNLYGPRSPLMTPAMCTFWLEYLHHLDADLVRAGLRRWVLFHVDRPPSLDQLQEQIGYVEDDRRQAKRSGSRTEGLTPLGSPAAVLAAAAEAHAANAARTPDQASYGHLIALLGERHLGTWLDEQGHPHARLTLADMAAQCRAWAGNVAASRPQLAQDLTDAAQQYDEMAADAAVPF